LRDLQATGHANLVRGQVTEDNRLCGSTYGGNCWVLEYLVAKDCVWLTSCKVEDRQTIVVLQLTNSCESGLAHLEANASERRRLIQELVGPDLPQPDAPESLLP
jgi:hypothetical protein